MQVLTPAEPKDSYVTFGSGNSRTKGFLRNAWFWPPEDKSLKASGAVGRRYVPLWLSVEQGTGGVDVDHLLVDEGPVALLGVLLGGVPEEATADCLLHAHRGLPTGDHVQLVPDEDKLP